MNKSKIKNQKSKVKKGDRVRVVLGKDRGKEGNIEKVLPREGKVIVSGVNVYKRHISPKRFGQTGEGGIIDIQKPLNASNIMLICPNCKKPTRVGFKITKSLKTRICRKCGKEIISEQVKS